MFFEKMENKSTRLLKTCDGDMTNDYMKKLPMTMNLNKDLKQRIQTPTSAVNIISFLSQEGQKKH